MAFKNSSHKRIAVSTGGGDCPGLNAVIRAVVKTAINVYGWDVVGIRDGLGGLIEKAKSVPLTLESVRGIIDKGGTILGTTNRGNPFKYPFEMGDEVVYKDISEQLVEEFKLRELDALISIGGDGSLSIACKLMDLGIPVVGVPKTIDNDLDATDVTFGFDSAVRTATEALDKLESTAESHHRVMIVEMMGRYCGWIALHSGIAGGASAILIPEIPFNVDKVCYHLKQRQRRGEYFSLVCVAEGATAIGGDLVALDSESPNIRLGGIGHMVSKQIEQRTSLETRVVVLGHLQRGGSPTAYDRILATRFGEAAVHQVAQGNFGSMVALKGQNIVAVPMADATKQLKKVDPDGPLVNMARSLDICFGDPEKD